MKFLLQTEREKKLGERCREERALHDRVPSSTPSAGPLLLGHANDGSLDEQARDLLDGELDPPLVVGLDQERELGLGAGRGVDTGRVVDASVGDGAAGEVDEFGHAARVENKGQNASVRGDGGRADVRVSVRDEPSGLLDKVVDLDDGVEVGRVRVLWLSVVGYLRPLRTTRVARRTRRGC